MLEHIYLRLKALPELQLVAVLPIPVIFAIVVHEVAHGWVAKLLGDLTASRLGRLSLNPVKHIDPVGTLLVPAVLLLLQAPVFGWARPVPVAWENLRHPKRDMALVAAAGPAANLLMAIGWGLVIQLAGALPVEIKWIADPLYFMGLGGIFANVLLMVFNLLPLPPLDGGRVAVGLLPGPWAWRLSRVEPYGFIILIGLMFTGLLWMVIGPVAEWVTRFVVSITGIA